MQGLDVSLLRWPGGNFSSNYHWMDGIGPRNDRPPRLEMAWGTVESNRFGTHEFLDYAALLNTEPYICANLGTGTWTDVDALDFATPNTGAAPGALDGNAVANRAAVNGTIAGLALAPSATLWVRWVGPHENLGDLTYRAEFSGYEPVDGVWLPMSFNVVSDFKDNVQLRLHVDRYVLDGDVGDLAAPAAVR